MVFANMSAGCMTVLLNTLVPQPDCTKINHKLITMLGFAGATASANCFVLMQD